MNFSMKYKFLEKIKALDFVDAIYLYGSRARGVHDERSDIDIAIVCPRASDTDWLALLDIIDNADTLLEIDCVRYDKISDQELKEQIDRNHRVLYEKGG